MQKININFNGYEKFSLQFIPVKTEQYTIVPHYSTKTFDLQVFAIQKRDRQEFLVSVNVPMAYYNPSGMIMTYRLPECLMYFEHSSELYLKLCQLFGEYERKKRLA